jgi:hypothetical protein
MKSPRPFGRGDFHAVRLPEWSVCAVPCNPAALLVGVVSAGKSHQASPSATQNGCADLAERRREEQRMDRIAEARRLVRWARR